MAKRIIKPVKSVVKKEAEVLVETPAEELVTEVEDKQIQRVSKKECFFCKNKSKPTYTDLTNLRRFLTDRAKIVNKERSGVCSSHQRQVAKNIKWARHLSLLPFVPKV